MRRRTCTSYIYMCRSRWERENWTESVRSWKRFEKFKERKRSTSPRPTTTNSIWTVSKRDLRVFETVTCFFPSVSSVDSDGEGSLVSWMRNANTVSFRIDSIAAMCPSERIRSRRRARFDQIHAFQTFTRQTKGRLGNWRLRNWRNWRNSCLSETWFAFDVESCDDIYRSNQIVLSWRTDQHLFKRGEVSFVLSEQDRFVPGVGTQNRNGMRTSFGEIQMCRVEETEKVSWIVPLDVFSISNILREEKSNKNMWKWNTRSNTKTLSIDWTK